MSLEDFFLFFFEKFVLIKALEVQKFDNCHSVCQELSKRFYLSSNASKNFKNEDFHKKF